MSVKLSLMERPLIEDNPKAKPLALALLAAAEEQGASPEDIRIAGEIAYSLTLRAVDRCELLKPEIFRDAKSAFESL